MHWSSLTMIFVAAVLGAPAPAPVPFTVANDVMDQGDGFYLATFDDAGVAEVQFTPIAELGELAPAPVSENLAVRDTNILNKRSTTCTGDSNNVGDLDWANVRLADNANQKWYDFHAWGWVHNNAETSYFCNYQRNYLTRQLILDMHVVVSDVCGGSQKYGYDRRTNGGGAADLAVGRTFRGDRFCDNDFHGKV